MVQLNMFIMAFVFILVGVVLLGSISNEIVRTTQANTVSDEQITLVNQSTTSLANNQLDSFTSLVNATNATDIQVLNTDYTVDTSGGSVTSLGPAGLFNATYIYREVGDNTSRTLVNLVILFFALGVLFAGIGFGIKALKEAGIM